MEQPYNWREILDIHEIEYNFSGTCIRTDGSAYGHPGTTCHKGVEGSPEEYKKAAKSGSLSSGSSAEAFELTKQIVSEAGVSTSNLNTDIAVAYDRHYSEYMDKLDKGEVSQEEVVGAFRDIPKDSYKDVEFLVVGMEPGLSDTISFGNTATSKGQNSIAAELAYQKLNEEFDHGEVRATYTAKLFESQFQSSGSISSNTFIDISTQLSSRVVTGDANSQVPSDTVKAMYGTAKVMSVNMSGVASFKTQYGNPGTTKVGKGTEDKMDPDRSGYGYLAGKNGRYPKLTRSYFEKNVNQERANQVADAVIYAANNGKLKAGYGAPGGPQQYKTYQNTVLRAFHDKGYKVYETEVMLGTGGKTNNKHVVHAVDLGNGKTFVSSDFSLNRFGYGQKVNNNPYKAYETGRQLAETARRNPGSVKE